MVALKKCLAVGITFVILLLVTGARATLSYYTNMPADIVIGQADFVTSSANQGGTVGANTLYSPDDIALCNGRLVVSDSTNNRVLIYNSIPTSNNTSADVVIGQRDFVNNSANQGGSIGANTLRNPTSVLCVAEKLLIADNINRRVLVFNSLPTSNNASADVVIGQQNFSTGTANQGGSCAANTLNNADNHPGITYDGQRLYISDNLNHRILIYNQIPTSNNASADLVLGQANFTSCLRNRTGSSSAENSNTLSRPNDVYSDGTRLYVADGDAGRVLIWNSPPTQNGQEADVVIGQPNFTFNSSFYLNATSLYNPRGIFALNGRMYVNDFLLNRFLIYNSIPSVNGAPADIILAQPYFNTYSSPCPQATSKNICGSGIYATESQLFVADRQHNRVLIFNNVHSTPKLSVSAPFENVGDHKKRIVGNVVLGERSRYLIHKIEVSVNSGPFNDVLNKDARDEGDSETKYSFYHDFEPWSDNGTKETWEERGFSVKVRAISYNDEENSFFYFEPFYLSSLKVSSVPQVTFLVNKHQWQAIKDNADFFEVDVKPLRSELWTTMSDKIFPEDKIFNSTTGEISVLAKPKAGILLSSGDYLIKIVIQDKWGHRRESNSLPASLPVIVGGAANPNGLSISETWFPLQINRIMGINTGIISSFNPDLVKSEYISNSLKPVFEGIAYSGSTVAMSVTDLETNQVRSYSTKVIDSLWKITPELYVNSVINLSVYDETGRYNEILPLIIKKSE